MTKSNVCDISKRLNEGSLSVAFYSSDSKSVIKVPKSTHGKKEINYDDGVFGDISYSEIDSSCRILSPCLIKCLCIFSRGECGSGFDISYRLELCEGSVVGLFKFVPGVTNIITYGDFKCLFLTACIGIRHLHRNNCYHLDLSEGNLLYKNVNGLYVSKIIDAGLSNYIERDHNNVQQDLLSKRLRVTSTTRPPEIFSQDSKYKLYSNKVDVWSLGILFLSYLVKMSTAELFNVNTFYKRLSKKVKSDHKRFIKLYDIHIMNEISRMFGNDERFNITIDRLFKFSPVPARELEDFKDLISSMLKIDPLERLNIEDVMDHRYFFNDPLFRTGMIGKPINFKRMIQLKFDNFVIKQPLKTLPNHTLSKFSYDGFKMILDISENYRELSEEEQDLSIENVCCAIDIYMRIVSMYETDITHCDSIVIGLLSLRFMLGLYYNIENDVSFRRIIRKKQIDYEISNVGSIAKKMTELEGPCLKLLEGIIKHLYFFDLCDTSDEIAVVINKIFFCESKLEVMNSYMFLDFNKIVKDAKLEVSTTNRYVQKLNKWTVVSEMLINVESLIKGELPSTPKLEVLNDTKMTKEKSFSNLINYIKLYKHDLSVYDFAIILDLFLYYVSSTKDTEYEYIGEVCVNLVYSVKIKKVYVPFHLRVLKRIEYLWSSISKSQAYTKTKKNRIFECFKTIEDVNKFFYYMVFAINGKSGLIKEQYDCLYMYDTWDLSKIYPLIKIKDTPPSTFTILELL